MASTPFFTTIQNRVQSNHHHPIHTELQSTAASTTTAYPSHRRPTPSAALASFEGSGSGEPSGDDQTEEEEEPGDEVGSGIPTEASGADDPVGKSLLFHFIHPWCFDRLGGGG